MSTNTICNVPAPELVEGGYILPPKVVVKEMEMAEKGLNYDRDANYMLHAINDENVDKILIAARTTKQIIGLVSQTDFCVKLQQSGYSWMMITSKTGAIIDGEKVDRETFFETLNTWGKTKGKRFVVIHHSILSEGINVNGLKVFGKFSCETWTTLVSVKRLDELSDWAISLSSLV